jgi:hypothetical protein
MVNVGLRNLSEAEIVTRTYTQFGKATAYHEAAFSRSAENFRFYSGLDADKGQGQWPADDVQNLTLEGRHISTYNFCQPIVDNIAGGMAKTPYKTSYSPIKGPLTTLTDILHELYITDRELCDWPIAKLEGMLHMLIYRADFEMYRNFEYDTKFGNIGMRLRLPGSVV